MGLTLIRLKSFVFPMFFILSSFIWRSPLTSDNSSYFLFIIVWMLFDQIYLLILGHSWMIYKLLFFFSWSSENNLWFNLVLNVFLHLFWFFRLNFWGIDNLLNCTVIRNPWLWTGLLLSYWSFWYHRSILNYELWRFMRICYGLSCIRLFFLLMFIFFLFSFRRTWFILYYILFLF